MKAKSTLDFLIDGQDAYYKKNGRAATCILMSHDARSKLFDEMEAMGGVVVRSTGKDVESVNGCEIIVMENMPANWFVCGDAELARNIKKDVWMLMPPMEEEATHGT